MTPAIAAAASELEEARTWLEEALAGLDAIAEIASEAVRALAPGDPQRQPYLDVVLGHHLIVTGLAAIAGEVADA